MVLKHWLKHDTDMWIHYGDENDMILEIRKIKGGYDFIVYIQDDSGERGYYGSGIFKTKKKALRGAMSYMRNKWH